MSNTRHAPFTYAYIRANILEVGVNASAKHLSIGFSLLKVRTSPLAEPWTYGGDANVVDCFALEFGILDERTL